jgi:hypothetical protein
MPRILFLIAVLALTVAANSCGPGNTASEVEPNDSPATATVLSDQLDFIDEDGPVTSGSLTPSDVDFFAITVPADGMLTVSLDDMDRGEFGDPILQILRPDGTVAASGDDDGPGFLPQISAYTEDGGDWLVLVTGFGFDTNGFHRQTLDYDLIVATANVAGIATELEPNNTRGMNDTPSSAEPLPAKAGRAVIVTGDLTLDDKDVYSFQVPAGKKIRAAAYNEEGFDQADAIIRILDGTEAVVAEDDDSGPGFMPNAEHQAGVSGTYHVEVSPFQTPVDFRYRLVVALD